MGDDHEDAVPRVGGDASDSIDVVSDISELSSVFGAAPSDLSDA